nr:hypothetical protein [Tanacetum cinerariifolium]
MAPVTRQGQNPPPPNTDTPPHYMTPKSVQAMIDQALMRNSTNGDGSQSSHEDNPRHVQTTRPCFYADFMKCHPLNFKGNEGVVGLTRWIKKIEFVFNISCCVIENQEVLKKKISDKYYPQGELKKLEIKLWNLKFVANENEKIDKYISGLLDNIYWNVKSSKPRSLDEIIELTNDLMDQKLRTYAKRADNKRKTDDMSSGNANVANAQRDGKETPKGNGCFECEASGHFKRDCPKLKNKNGGNRNAQGWVYAVGNEEKNKNAPMNPDSNVVMELGSGVNTFTKGSLSTGASRLSSMIVDSAAMLCLVVEEGVPAVLTGTRTVGAGETGLSTRGGSSQNRRDLPMDNPLVSVEVLSEDGNPARANIKQALGSNNISEVACFEVSGKEILSSTVNLMHLRQRIWKPCQGGLHKDGDAETSFQQSQVHSHILILKTQCHYNIKKD